MLSSVSLAMADAAEKTSGQAVLVSAASEEVISSVSAVSANSGRMSNAIRKIAQNTSESTRIVAEAVTAASSANDTVSLGDASAEIGKVIDIITSIAQQTNLLALNARLKRPAPERPAKASRWSRTR